MRAVLILAAIFLPATANAATRTDVANDARAIVAQVEQCDHPTDAVRLAYLQTRKAVSVVQMTTVLPYVAYPTEADIASLAGRVLPAPRTTNGRLLDEGHGWFVAALATLDAAEVCS